MRIKISYSEIKTETEFNSDLSKSSSDDEDTRFYVRNVCNIALLDIGHKYVVDRESNIPCPVDCLKFTLQYKPGPINCIDKGLAPHKYFFFFFHLLAEEFLQNITNKTNTSIVIKRKK